MAELYRRKYKDPKTGKTKLSPYWSADYTVGDRRYRYSLRVKDKKSAGVLMHEHIRHAERVMAGLEQEDPEGISISHALAVHAQDMIDRGLDEVHRGNVLSQLRRIFGAEDGIACVTPEWAEDRLKDLTEQRRLRPQTANRYRAALSSLFTVLKRKKLWVGENPVTAVPKHGAKAVARAKSFERRALTPEEAKKLTNDPRIPWERRICYAVILGTGLRRGEAKALRASNLDLDRGLIYLHAKDEKAGRGDELPVPAGVLDMLRLHMEELSPNDPLLQVPKVETLLNDALRLGIPVETAAGLLDLHALRVTYCVRLAERGVPAWLAMRLMRHKKADLTAKIYARFAPHDRIDAAQLSDPTQIPEVEDTVTVPLSTLRRILCHTCLPDVYKTLGLNDRRNPMQNNAQGDTRKGVSVA